MFSNLVNAILANPGRSLGVAGAVILAVLETLVGKGVLTPDALQTAQNIGAIVVVLITTFLPTWKPVEVMALRHKDGYK